jgi:hypothetical protein
MVKNDKGLTETYRLDDDELAETPPPHATASRLSLPPVMPPLD